MSSLGMIIQEHEYKEVKDYFKKLEDVLGVHLKKRNAQIVSYVLEKAAIFASSLKHKDEQHEEKHMKIWLQIFNTSFLESVQFSMELNAILYAEVERMKKVANKKSS